MSGSGTFNHPKDTLISASLRFSVEVLSWISGPWAVGMLSPVGAVIFSLVLISLPAIFSTPADKKKVLIPIPGSVRVCIEAFLYLVALIAPWIIWPNVFCITCTVVIVLSVITGIPRYHWLLSGVNRSGTTQY